MKTASPLSPQHAAFLYENLLLAQEELLAKWAEHHTQLPVEDSSATMRVYDLNLLSAQNSTEFEWHALANHLRQKHGWANVVYVHTGKSNYMDFYTEDDDE